MNTTKKPSGATSRSPRRRPISAEQISEIESELRLAHGYIHLQCDDYRVCVRVEPFKTRTYVLSVYVDGWIRGEWLSDDCEQRRRFMCPKSMALYTKKQQAEIVKTFGKRRAAKHFPRLHERHEYWVPYWNSARSMLRHFCANNEKVTVLSIGEPLPEEDKTANEAPNEHGSNDYRAGTDTPRITVSEGTDEVVAQIHLGGTEVLEKIFPGISGSKTPQNEGSSNDAP